MCLGFRRPSVAGGEGGRYRSDNVKLGFGNFIIVFIAFGVGVVAEFIMRVFVTIFDPNCGALYRVYDLVVAADVRSCVVWGVEGIEPLLVVLCVSCGVIFFYFCKVGWRIIRYESDVGVWVRGESTCGAVDDFLGD